MTSNKIAVKVDYLRDYEDDGPSFNGELTILDDSPKTKKLSELFRTMTLFHESNNIGQDLTLDSGMRITVLPSHTIQVYVDDKLKYDTSKKGDFLIDYGEVNYVFKINSNKKIQINVLRDEVIVLICVIFERFK